MFEKAKAKREEKQRQAENDRHEAEIDREVASNEHPSRFSGFRFWDNKESNERDRRVYSHSGQPIPGDIFLCPMESGKTGCYQIREVDWCRDPRNMFFADVRFMGYEDELNLPDPPKKSVDFV